MQHKELIGEELCKYQLWETHRITPDGNCLYRTLSTLIFGIEHSHSEVRATIARIIASEGTTQMANYFKGKQMTPCDYLTNSLNDLEGVRGTDVEIISASTKQLLTQSGLMMIRIYRRRLIILPFP